MSSLPRVFDFELVGTGAIPQDVIDRSRASASAVGYALGWSQGLRDARESIATERAEASEANRKLASQASTSVEALLVSIAAAAAQLEASAQLARERDEDAILAAAVEIAEALMGRELADTDRATRNALARALRLAPAHEPVTVRLNPTVYATMSEKGFDALLGAVVESSGRTIVFEPDPTLGVGDALATCTATSIDARLSEGVRRVREHLARASQGGREARELQHAQHAQESE
jgi:flagellar assembly protein FliH